MSWNDFGTAGGWFLGAGRPRGETVPHLRLRNGDHLGGAIRNRRLGSCARQLAAEVQKCLALAAVALERATLAQAAVAAPGSSQERNDAAQAAASEPSSTSS